jgi:hypothetical protein
MQSLFNFRQTGGTISSRGTPCQEIYNSRAAIAGKILPSPLPIRRSFKSAVIPHQNAASLAVWQRKMIRGVPVVVDTVRLLHKGRL